jgi:hypothetical protein
MRLVSWLAAKADSAHHRTRRRAVHRPHHRAQPPSSLLLAAYGGIGLAVALAYARDLLYGSRSYERIWNRPRWDQPNPELLVGSLVMLFFAVMGARAVFSQPIALRANWIFRITAVARPPSISPPSASRSSRWWCFPFCSRGRRCSSPSGPPALPRATWSSWQSPDS